jgi:hypothetical protein
MALAVPQGHGKELALAAGMAKPARDARSDKIVSSARTFFAITKTSQGLLLLQSERSATSMIDRLRSYVVPGKRSSRIALRNCQRKRPQGLKPHDGCVFRHG